MADLPICIMLTGGTVVETTEGGLVGVKKSDDVKRWIAAMPEVLLMRVQIDIQVFHTGSDSDFTPELWLSVCRFIYEHRSDYSGFVIVGSIANIPYLGNCVPLVIENFHFPVVLTGSQLPDYLLEFPSGLPEILLRSKDVGLRANMINAIHMVQNKMNGCYVVAGDKIVPSNKIEIGEPFATFPYSFPSKILSGKVEFSIKLSEAQGERDTVFLPHLETRVRFFEVTPLLTKEFILKECEGAEGALFSISPTVSLPDTLFSILASRETRIPCVVFGHALMTPDGIGLNDLRDSYLKKGVIITREEGRAWVTLAFMWTLAQTKDPAFIRRIFT
ncbi:MAG: asparaginase [Candidatus Jacksonbacteria bacterium]|nr:asparaginase [Candidatus Jacksonbacteria bacterium]